MVGVSVKKHLKKNSMREKLNLVMIIKGLFAKFIYQIKKVELLSQFGLLPIWQTVPRLSSLLMVWWFTPN